VVILGGLADSRAVNPLIDCLKDGRVSYAAVVSLGKIRDKRAIEPLVACLKGKDANLIYPAAHALSMIGEPATESLISCLKEKDFEVRRAAIVAIGWLADKRTTEPLIALLKSEDARDCCVAADTLGQLRDERALEPLIACLRDPRYDVARSAAKALGKLGDKRAVSELIASLNESGVSAEVAQSLGELGDNRAVEPLIACLGSSVSNALTGPSVVRALGELGDQRAVKPLTAVLPYCDGEVLKSLEKSQWKPTTEKEHFYCSVAKGDKKTLLEDWRRTRRFLLDDSRSKDSKKAKNAILTAIDLGQADMVADLVRFLDSCEDKWLAEQYLNCGQEDLKQAAMKWSDKHGYSITQGLSGGHSTWGGR
jgi:HEAT repeat protein